ncbi:hypothetical protein HanIR_Chr09g0411761 [Helianthus annuus]|nr:hypothetical protein HanIR_Chr09g0411761 [Helianthus annuus]
MHACIQNKHLCFVTLCIDVMFALLPTNLTYLVDDVLGFNHFHIGLDLVGKWYVFDGSVRRYK